MSIEVAALAAQGLNPAATQAPGLQAGYGVSLTDIGGFERAIARLEAQHVSGPSKAAEQFMKPFEHINTEAVRISEDANAAKAAGRDMSPSEIITLTVRCQEFSFHCQLVSNIANRTSDGLQQLFRQQS